MKKKLLSVVLATAMVATLLVGCGGKTEEAAAPAETKTEETKLKKKRQLLQTRQQVAVRLVWQCLPRIYRDGIRMVPTWRLS